MVALYVDEDERLGDSDSCGGCDALMSTMMRILMTCALDDVRVSDDGVELVWLCIRR